MIDSETHTHTHTDTHTQREIVPLLLYLTPGSRPERRTTRTEELWRLEGAFLNRVLVFQWKIQVKARNVGFSKHGGVLPCRYTPSGFRAIPAIIFATGDPAKEFIALSAGT